MQRPSNTVFVDMQADYKEACKQLEEAEKLLDFVEVCQTMSKLCSWQQKHALAQLTAVTAHAARMVAYAHLTQLITVFVHAACCAKLVQSS